MSDTAAKLTYAECKAIQPGQTLHDHVVTGLQLRARATKKTWHVYYRAAGIERRPAVGSWPAMGIDDARAVARRLLARIALGDDPSEERQKDRAQPTVSDLCDWYVNKWAESRKSVASYREDRRQIALYIVPLLGSLRLSAVTIDDIEKCTDAVYSRTVPGQRPGPPAGQMAVNCRALLSSLFNLAETRFRGPDGTPARPQQTNPVYKAKRYPRVKHRRHSDGSELAAVAGALRQMETRYPAHVATIRVIIYTGARPVEISAATWQELDGAALVKAAHKTAGKIGDKRIELPPPALDIVTAQPRRPGRDQIFSVDKWVSDKHQHAHGLRHVWDQVRAMAGCPDLQLRDARRTYVAYGLSRGYTLDQIGELLGHTTNATTKIYADLLPSDRRGAADGIADDIAKHMKGE